MVGRFRGAVRGCGGLRKDLAEFDLDMHTQYI